MKKSLFKLLALIAVFFVIGIFVFKIKTSHAPTNITLSPQPENLDQGSGDSLAAIQPSTGNTNNEPAKNSPDANSLTFAVIGDTKSFRAGNPNGNLEKAVASLSKQDFAFAFVMGDLVSSCDGGSSCEKKYADWKSVMAPILSKTYAVQGNHDRTGGNSADAVWQKVFNLPTNGPAGYGELTYSFDAGDSHFVVLTSEKPHTNIVDDVQRNWLDQDLAANKKTDTFIFLHQPAFQMSQDSEDALDAKPAERDQFWDILKKHSVTAVFNGHLHMIAGKVQDGIHQFVIGDTDSTADDVPQPNLVDFGMTGHHYALVNVDGNNTKVQIYSLDGNLEKEYSFSK